MQKKTLSILEELESLHRPSDSRYIIESRANNLIASAIHLIEMIEECYTEDESDNLTRKLLNSIKNKDISKFRRSQVRINKRNNK